MRKEEVAECKITIFAKSSILEDRLGSEYTFSTLLLISPRDNTHPQPISPRDNTHKLNIIFSGSSHSHHVANKEIFYFIIS